MRTVEVPSAAGLVGYCSTTYPEQCVLSPIQSYQPPRFYKVQLGGGGISGYPLNITSPSNDECLLLQGPPWVIVNGSCSGSSSTAWANVTGGTNTSAAMVVGTGASLTYTGSGSINASEIAGLAWPSLVSSDCLTNNGTTLSWGTCGSGGSTTFQVNGTGLASSTTVNFENSAATDGLTLTFTNPSAGIVQLGFTGTLSNSGLANSATTVNTETCTLGSTCTIPFDINSSALTSQAGLNFITSTTNSVGLTATPSNPGANEVKWEITGSSYTGNASTATNLASYPTLCSGGEFSEGLSSGSNNCATPSGGGTVTTTGSPSSGNIAAFSGSTSITTATAAQILAAINNQTCNAQTGTTYTFALTDANNCVTMSNASANTITVPTNASVAYAVGTTLAVIQAAAGVTTLSPASGVTLQSAKYGSSGTQTYAFAAEYSCIALQQTATNVWYVSECDYNPGSGSGVSSFTGDGTLISNSGSTGAVTATLENTGVGYGVFGNTGSSSGSPAYHAMSSYPTAAFPTFNQNTTGSAGSLTALSGLPAQAADTIVANATGSSASPTAESIGSERMAWLQASTTFTLAATGCTPSAHAGGPFAGTITLASGPCTSIVITMNGATGFTDSNGYDCTVGDQTAQNSGTYIPKWGQTTSNSTTATLPIPSAAGATDVISFTCHPNSI